MSDTEIEISLEEYETSEPQRDAASDSTSGEERLAPEQVSAPLTIDWDNLPALPSLNLDEASFGASKPQATASQDPETIPFWTE